MDYQEILEEIKVKILPILEREDVELVESSLSWGKNCFHLKLLVDKKTGRINLEECARLNEKISNLLDELDIIKERFILEVSSPGIDRPLKTKNDFLRVRERKIIIFLSDTVSGKREFEGILKDIDDGFIYLEVKKEVVKIPFEKVASAKQML